MNPTSRAVRAREMMIFSALWREKNTNVRKRTTGITSLQTCSEHKASMATDPRLSLGVSCHWRATSASLAVVQTANCLIASHHYSVIEGISQLTLAYFVNGIILELHLFSCFYIYKMANNKIVNFESLWACLLLFVNYGFKIEFTAVLVPDRSQQMADCRRDMAGTF